MKVYGSYVKHYTIEVEVPDNATTDEAFNAVVDEIDSLYCTDSLENSEDDEQIISIVDENGNCVWES